MKSAGDSGAGQQVPLGTADLPTSTDLSRADAARPGACRSAAIPHLPRSGTTGFAATSVHVPVDLRDRMTLALAAQIDL